MDKLEELPAPQEFTLGFDPSVISGVYSIESIDVDSGKVGFAYEWPQDKKGEKLSSTITCPIWDSKFFDLGSKTPRYMSGEDIVKKISSTSLSKLMFLGICSDASCQTMNKGCTLKIIQEKYEPK